MTQQLKKISTSNLVEIHYTYFKAIALSIFQNLLRCESPQSGHTSHALTKLLSQMYFLFFEKCNSCLQCKFFSLMHYVVFLWHCF